MLAGTDVLSTAQMRAIESAAMASGEVSGAALIERAGAAVAGQIRLLWPRAGQAVILCGPGNSGGDGYVVARLLAQAGWQLRVLGAEPRAGSDAAGMAAAWRRLGPVAPLTMTALRETPPPDLLVDAIFGTGLTRPPEGEIAAVLAHLAAEADRIADRIVAVDAPSGLCLDSGAWLGAARPVAEGRAHRARLTVAFDSPKPGHLLDQGPLLCGRLVVADIGLAGWRARALAAAGPGARVTALSPGLDGHAPALAGDLARRLGKDSARQAHKYSHGHAVIIAGGLGQGGAARLSARAALRVGAGLVTICPPSPALIEHLAAPDALMRRRIDDGPALEALLTDRRIAALCLGPGCGTARAAALLPALLESGRACVLDADALTALAAAGLDGLHAGCVLTPHGGEFARLFPDLAPRLGEASRGPAFSRLDAARAAAARSGAVVLLKGPDTVIASPDGAAAIHSDMGVPWLATAGSGDVLAGLIAGLLARGQPPLEAAALGALLHARAARHVGPGLIADDLPEALPAVLRDLGA